MTNMENMKNLEKSKEKEFTERAKRIQRTISLLKSLACVLAVIAAVFMFFHVRNDYNNYAGSQLVMAEVINVEGADDKNINVTYRYNIADKEYESGKIQPPEKIKKGDKREIRVKKNNPEVILKYNDINYAVLCDVLIGLCLWSTVLCLYEMATCTLLSAVEEVTECSGFTTKQKRREKNKRSRKCFWLLLLVLQQFFSSENHKK